MSLQQYLELISWWLKWEILQCQSLRHRSRQHHWWLSQLVTLSKIFRAGSSIWSNRPLWCSLFRPRRNSEMLDGEIRMVYLQIRGRRTESKIRTSKAVWIPRNSLFFETSILNSSKDTSVWSLWSLIIFRIKFSMTIASAVSSLPNRSESSLTVKVSPDLFRISNAAKNYCKVENRTQVGQQQMGTRSNWTCLGQDISGHKWALSADRFTSQVKRAQ